MNVTNLRNVCELIWFSWKCTGVLVTWGWCQWWWCNGSSGLSQSDGQSQIVWLLPCCTEDDYMSFWWRLEYLCSFTCHSWYRVLVLYTKLCEFSESTTNIGLQLCTTRSRRSKFKMARRGSTSRDFTRFRWPLTSLCPGNVLSIGIIMEYPSRNSTSTSTSRFDFDFDFYTSTSTFTLRLRVSLWAAQCCHLLEYEGLTL